MTLDVVLYQEDGCWIAQGLQFDITTHGDSPMQAVGRFDARAGAELAISLELRDGVPFGGIAPAPKKFWDMFEAADAVQRRFEIIY